MIVEKIEQLIGNTPIIKLNKHDNDNMADIYVKLENLNITGSIKIRAAYQMIIDAIEFGVLTKDKKIIEPTSGNTGIALAYIANLLGYDISIVMPETMSRERIEIMKAYNANVILTDGKLGMSGAIKKANEIAKSSEYVLLQQFKNNSNVKAHYETTGLEIINDFDKLDAFVAGIGTGGTITGVSKRLKEKFKNIKVYGVEPKESAVLSTGIAGLHKIQGIGAGFIPEILDQKCYDEIITISSNEALSFVKEIYLSDGLFIGISTAANILAAQQVAQKLGPNHSVLTIAADGGEKYISNNVFDFSDSHD